MRTLRRTTTAALGLAGALAAVTLGGVPAAAAAPASGADASTSRTAQQAATWELVALGGGGSQSVCGEAASDRVPHVYVQLDGSWSTEIEIGAGDLPPGVTYNDFGAVLPGANESGTEVAGVFSLNLPAAPAGTTHRATLWATDGSERQTVPLVIEWKDDC
ncbi:hypothetical protein HTV45_11370 [Streptomyces sp. CHD11]|uniref:DUF5980 family protein n=1 Tax=Streptomyces sp. CHD11 TaxID=2741325 RepID=UPI001BFC5E19|nr:DUF5980 family protein [Streptomyces sp. CHD11]MBT3151475.1 hypothetical protein [Streptomyces sp. CHD11]